MTGTASRFASRLRGVRHKSYVRAFSRLAPYHLVNEYPKSGGTWLSLMLADALGVPFRRNSPIRFERSVVHGHFLGSLGLYRPVILWRDPRDLLVSFYFHCYFINQHQNRQLVEMMKVRRPYEDYDAIRANLPEFIRFVSASPVSPSFSWPSFVAAWARRPDTCQVTYEALRADTLGELSRVVREVTGADLPAGKAADVVEAHRFEQAKASAEANMPEGVELSFLREGALGSWVRYFSEEALCVLRETGYAEPMMVLGYDLEAGLRPE